MDNFERCCYLDGGVLNEYDSISDDNAFSTSLRGKPKGVKYSGCKAAHPSPNIKMYDCYVRQESGDS